MCIDSSLWAIAAEFQFYLLFPFLLLFFRRYGYKYLIGVILLASIARFLVYFFMGSVWNVAYMTIFGRIDQFIIGMIFGLSFDRIKTKLKHPVVLVSSLLFVGAYIGYVHTYSLSSKEGYHWTFLPGLEALVWAFFIATYNASSFNFKGKIARIFAFGGTLSFSLYVMHPFILRLGPWFASLICTPHNRYPFLASLAAGLHNYCFLSSILFGLAVVFPLTFLISILTYFLIEKPFLELREVYTHPSRAALENIVTSEKIPVRV